jgi:hypothetical protein
MNGKYAMQRFDQCVAHCFLMLVASAAFAANAAPVRDAAQGLRFDSPGVLDLSVWPAVDHAGRDLGFTPLSPDDGERILAEPEIGEDHSGLPFSAYLYGCAAESRACAAAGERKRIDTAGKAVLRAGKWLVVTPEHGDASRFIDWRMPTTKTADGDAETHYYLGRLHDGGYHRVEVQFDQDSPGSFLINPANGKVAFVHNGGDIVALSPDSMRIVDFGQFEATHPLRIAALDATGPRQELECALAKEKAALQFKGWHDAASIDMIVKTGGDKDAVTIPLRLALTAGVWAVAARDPKLLPSIGFVCRQEIPAAAHVD